MADLPEPFTPYLIVLGSNTAGRYFGSVFAEAEAELAMRAAGQMDLHAIRVVGEELVALAADLPRGKLFEKSGNAFVPLAARVKVEKLMALGEAAGTLSKPPKIDPADGAAGDAPDEGGKAVEPHRPSAPSEIMVGSIVLVSEGDTEGWWEAIALEMAPAEAPGDDLFTLRFRDFPDYERQVRRRADIALLPPPVEAL